LLKDFVEKIVFKLIQEKKFKKKNLTKKRWNFCQQEKFSHEKMENLPKSIGLAKKFFFSICKSLTKKR
jgi:hypothetical protein